MKLLMMAFLLASACDSDYDPCVESVCKPNQVWNSCSCHSRAKIEIAGDGTVLCRCSAELTHSSTGKK